MGAGGIKNSRALWDGNRYSVDRQLDVIWRRRFRYDCVERHDCLFRLLCFSLTYLFVAY